LRNIFVHAWSVKADMADAPISVFQGDLPIAAKLERARAELLDLSARNRLLNVPRFSSSARTVEVVDERSSEVFRLLAREAKACTFLPGRETAEEKAEAEADPSGDAALAELPQPAEDEAVDERGVASRHSDTKLQTRMTSKGLQKRLLDLYADARTLEEEQGVNVLYLALGMLKWVDPQNADNVRHAPLILLPVSLERGSAGERFRLRARPEDLSANLSLEAYLDRAHALRLPVLQSVEDFDPAGYFEAVAHAVETKSGWEVKPDDIVLGFFSFAKFLMYRDLDPANWPPGDTIADRPLIRSLLADGFGGQAELLHEDAPIDRHISPADMLHIVDCDSSQTLAVHDARQGRNLVIQGPPGTGKSQTISNIIASAIADGKTVLFVAEKMAALEVVKRRLDMAGVGDACLELHSSKANKRSVLDELRRTWDLGSPKGDGSQAVIRRLTEARDLLNAHVERMHRAHPVAGLTPHQVFGHLARLKQDGRSPVDFDLPAAPTWAREDLSSRQTLVAELAERILDIGLPDQHPWRGVGLDVVLPTAVERLMVRLGELLAGFESWTSRQTALARMLEGDTPPSLAATAPLMRLGRRVVSAPDLDAAALASEHWSDRAEEVVRLLSVGREFERLSAGLEGHASAGGLEMAVEDAAAALASLPPGFGAAAFGHVSQLRELLPRLLAGADQLEAELGRSGGERTLAALERIIATADRVAAAPDASPEAFAATVWDHGVEQAGDLAEAVASLERAKSVLGDSILESAWTTDVGRARQALATHTGVMKMLNAEWRQANALVRTVVRDPKAPLPELLDRLDTLAKAQASIQTIKEGHEFGKSAFGADWRGEKSASAPLVALVDWMRTLRGLGAEPRLIAGRTPQRTALAQMTSGLKCLYTEVRAKLEALRADAGGDVSTLFGDSLADDRVELTGLAARIAAVGAADEVARAAVPSAVLASERTEVLRRIAGRQAASRTIDDGLQLGAGAFGVAWQGQRSDWRWLAQAAHWIASNQDIRQLASRVADRAGLSELLGQVEAGQESLLKETGDVLAVLQAPVPALFGRKAIDDVPLADVTARLKSWLAHGEQLSKWVAYRERADRARDAGLTPVVQRLGDGRLAPVDAIPSFQMAYFEALLANMVRADPELGRFDGALHGARAQEFAALDLQRIDAARLEVVRAHHRRMPPQVGMGPVGVLRGEIARRRGHMPIRQLVQRAGPAIQALKPVLMMSPLSVAQFLTPGRMTFDLLVMDEASQIQPVDALGAIARCRQVVVVGDERQLPPTRFFSKMTGGGEDDDEDGASVADIESILGLFTARGLPQRMLRWHYRSRHQSLIAVSNRQFYESKLFIIPSPYTREAGMGLSFRHVPDGVFDSGGTGTNAAEAKLVAGEIIRHARTNPGHSLGVATFSSRQRRAIQDELEVLRRLSPDTEEFFHSHPGEPFFIKNLENVQGDERDVIMISVGYGRNANGTFSMRFGPLGSDGGERRLNVLISRAKRRCEVFASITDEDIDLERARGRGVFALKLFLHYARTGRLDVAHRSGREQDSVLEEQIGRALQERGYQVHPQVGIAGFFIDLAIADPDRPGRYLLGIECDGAAYHSSRSARDRDRLRQAVLEDHGWIIHRVWGSDWFQRPREQLDRIATAVEAARAELADRERAGNLAGRAVPIDLVTLERTETAEGDAAEVGQSTAQSIPYAEAVPNVPLGWEMHEVPSGQMADLVEQVVSVEGPVHLDEVVVRLRTAWGLQRAGGRIQAAVERGADIGVQRGRLVREGEFLSMPGQPIPVRDRGDVSSPSLRKPDALPPRELEAAVLQVARTGLGASVDEIAAAAPRLLGFKAVSAQLRGLVTAAVTRLESAGLLAREAGLLMAVETKTATVTS
jgi:very-short-patch-repair endonuclease